MPRKNSTETSATAPGTEELQDLYLDYRRRLTGARLAIVSALVVVSFLMDGVFEYLYRPAAFRAGFLVRIAVGSAAGSRQSHVMR